MHFGRCLTVFALVGSMVLVGAVVFAGGAEDSTDDAMAEPMEEPVTLTIWAHHPEAELEKLMSDYQELHPHISFEFLHIPWSNAGWAQKTMTGLLSDDLPDLSFSAQGGAEWSLPVRGVFASLNRYLERDNVSLDDIPDGVLNLMVLNDQVYAIPMNTDYNLMFYNKRMFEEAGITSLPETWAEFAEATEKLTKRDADGNLTQIGLAVNNRTGNTFLGWVYANNGNWFSRDGTTAMMALPESVEAARYLMSLRDIIGTYDEITTFAPRARGVPDSFIQEKSAMAYFYAVTQIGRIDQNNPDLEYGVFRTPLPPGGTHGALNTGVGSFKIPAAASHPDEAWDFLKYVYDNSLTYIVEAWKNGRAGVPARLSVLRHPDFMALHPQLPEIVETFEPISQYSQLIHIFATDANWINMGPAIDSFIHDIEPPEVALAQAQEKIQVELDRIFGGLSERGIEVMLERF